MKPVIRLVQRKSIGHATICSLLGVTQQQVLFIVNLQKLLHPYWVFAFTNSLSSNSLPRDVGVLLTSTLLQTTTPTIAQMVVYLIVPAIRLD